MTLGANTTLTTTNSAVTFSSTVNGTTAGSQSLTIAQGSGAVSFGGVVGSTTSLSSLAVSGSGSIALRSVTTSGAQSYSGTVTLDAASTFSASATTFNGPLAAGSYALTITADEIDFYGGTSSVTGTGALVLQPYTTTVAVQVVMGSDPGASVLALSALDISSLANGFSSITIGRTDGTGTLTIGTITFSDPLVLRSSANGIVLAGDVTTSGAQTYTGAVTLTANATVTTAGSGAISFSSTINGAYSLTIANGTSAVTLGGSVGASTNLAALSVAGSGAITVTGNVYSTSSILFEGSVTLAADTLLSATTLLRLGNGLTAGSYVFNMDAADLELGGNSDTKISGSGDIKFKTAAGRTIIVGGTSDDASAFHVSPTTLAKLEGFSNLIIGAADGNNPIQVNSDITFQFGITIQTSGTGSITVRGNIVIAPAGKVLVLSGSGNTTYLSANLTTNGGAVTINDSVVLGANALIDTTYSGAAAGASVTIAKVGSVGGTVNGGTAGTRSLTITAGTGAVSIAGALGGTASLSSVAITSTHATGITLGGSVTTSTTQVYTGAAVLSSSLTLSASSVVFSSTLATGTSSSAISADEIDFGGAVSGATVSS